MRDGDRVVVHVDHAGLGLAAWAISWTLPKVGMPEPMSRNWVTPWATA